MPGARRACQRGLWWEAAVKLSIAAEAWDDVSAALDAAMDRAGAERGRWLAGNTFTRVRVDGVDRWVHVDSVEVATVRHRTSRAGDPAPARALPDQQPGARGRPVAGG